MKPRLMMAVSILATLAIPLAAQAQGVVRGAEERAAVGYRAAEAALGQAVVRHRPLA